MSSSWQEQPEEEAYIKKAQETERDRKWASYMHSKPIPNYVLPPVRPHLKVLWPFPKAPPTVFKYIEPTGGILIRTTTLVRFPSDNTIGGSIFFFFMSLFCNTSFTVFSRTSMKLCLISFHLYLQSMCWGLWRLCLLHSQNHQLHHPWVEQVSVPLLSSLTSSGCYSNTSSRLSWVFSLEGKVDFPFFLYVVPHVISIFSLNFKGGQKALSATLCNEILSFSLSFSTSIQEVIHDNTSNQPSSYFSSSKEIHTISGFVLFFFLFCFILFLFHYYFDLIFFLP